MMRNYLVALILLITLVIESCAPLQTAERDKDSETVSRSSPNMEETPSPVITAPSDQENRIEGTPVQSPASVLRELTEKAKKDLASQFNYDMDQIKVTTTRAVTWKDTSLGCPQQDMQYAQALIPGFWILLETDSKQYPYHTDQKDQIVLCLDDLSVNAEGTPLPLIPVKPDDIKDGDPWEPIN